MSKLKAGAQAVLLTMLGCEEIIVTSVFATMIYFIYAADSDVFGIAGASVHVADTSRIRVLLPIACLAHEQDSEQASDPDAELEREAIAVMAGLLAEGYAVTVIPVGEEFKAIISAGGWSWDGFGVSRDEAVLLAAETLAESAYDVHVSKVGE